MSLSPIDGRLVAIKDNICTVDYPTTCASRILKGFESPFDATVVKRIRDSGAVILGKTNLDEFGMGYALWTTKTLYLEGSLGYIGLTLLIPASAPLSISNRARMEKHCLLEAAPGAVLWLLQVGNAMRKFDLFSVAIYISLTNL